MAIFIEKGGVFTPPRTPKVCRTWLIWALNPTYKSPLRNWKKIWPLWEICAPKNEFSPKNGNFSWINEVVLPPQDPQGLPGMAYLVPKSYLQVSSEKLKKKITLIWHWKQMCKFCIPKKALFEKVSALYPSSFPNFCRAWLIWTPYYTYMSTLRFWKKIQSSYWIWFIFKILFVSIPLFWRNWARFWVF